MLAAGIIVFREVLEAALVIGIILAATKGMAGSRRWIMAGIGLGLAGSLIVAFSAEALSAAVDGMGQEVFNAGILLVAVAMLAWHTAWMSRHGRVMAQEMRAVGQDVRAGIRPLSVLATVVGVSVLREGAETVLFLMGVGAGGSEGLRDVAVGLLLGAGAGTIAGGMLYLGLLRIPARHLFSVTTWLVMLLASGMAAQAVNYLAAAGVIDLASQPIWDSSALLSETSLPGRFAHILIGYVERPSLGQLMAWGGTLAGIAMLSRFVSSGRSPA